MLIVNVRSVHCHACINFFLCFFWSLVCGDCVNGFWCGWYIDCLCFCHCCHWLVLCCLIFFLIVFVRSWHRVVFMAVVVLIVDFSEVCLF